MQENSTNICDGGTPVGRWVAGTSQVRQTAAKVPDRGGQTYPCKTEA